MSPQEAGWGETILYKGIGGRPIQALSLLDILRGVGVTIGVPAARLGTLFLPGMLLQPGSVVDGVRDFDHAATSFGEAVQICLGLQTEAAKSAKLREA